jgi:3-dehydroquinate synthase
MSQVCVKVALAERSYPIWIGSGLLSDHRLMAAQVAGREVVVVTNQTIAPLYLDTVLQALGPRRLVSTVVLPDGEAHKTLDSIEQIVGQALADGHGRGTTFVALGGGVIGDMTGFAAAIYQRGARFVQLPTTLLAQVDSSVGGKTGVNHRLGKNLIGAFHQPVSVIIDVASLATLPARDYAAGLAEVIKYGLILDAGFYAELERDVEALQRRDPAVLIRHIQRSCELKAAVVIEDEREQGRRALLNLGHTFGHAIEAAAGYGQWLHGEAVAVGMVMALAYSAELGHIPGEEVERLRALLLCLGLPTLPPALSVDVWLDFMGRDKKVLDGRLRLILLRAIGSGMVDDRIDTAQLADFLGNFPHSSS